MNKTQAKIITGGGLSYPEKMPCCSYGLPVKACNVGKILAQKQGTVCHGCYALKLIKLRPHSVGKGLNNRLESLNHPQWIDAMVYLIKRDSPEYFRWHWSGDVVSLQHLENIIKVCEKTPYTMHWMPTREVRVLSQYQGKMPDNLIIRVSATMIDGKPLPYPNTSTVHQKQEPTGHVCPAPNQGGKCLDCRVCWLKDVKNVSYKKH